jgi:hypothetical protein
LGSAMRKCGTIDSFTKVLIEALKATCFSYIAQVAILVDDWVNSWYIFCTQNQTQVQSLTGQNRFWPVKFNSSKWT